MLVPVWLVVMTGAAVAVPVRSSAVSAARAIVQALFTLMISRPRLRPPGGADTCMGDASCYGSMGEVDAVTVLV
ncbi:hypothetical protein GCM10019016_022550 [Streptomyces prasinosporus]|uniref:Secreted protein n=1 Tax=Streptomyces prasinosporus TaxID=68256 RepID=A0ABP6TK93_9ACTN|nr:hypothetical protein GCM10010332_06090 [Streptomyces albogriseolus]GHG01107.1 hypothetical protein GCM10018777_09560 [Streptomyces viridodiastaticus]